MTDLTRRELFRSFAVFAVAPYVPLLGVNESLPGAITFVREETIANPDGTGFYWCAVAVCDGRYASYVATAPVDPRVTPKLQQAVRAKAREDFHEHFRRQHA